MYIVYVGVLACFARMCDKSSTIAQENERTLLQRVSQRVSTKISSGRYFLRKNQGEEPPPPSYDDSVNIKPMEEV